MKQTVKSFHRPEKGRKRREEGGREEGGGAVILPAVWGWILGEAKDFSGIDQWPVTLGSARLTGAEYPHRWLQSRVHLRYTNYTFNASHLT